ncbi:PAS domain-containing protein [Oscillatoriales cyanobacterium LEGE 11467]|uniref:PAS domain-containing protein n=1 Tax=Zarconia navalis LEGE 11467 TaxID=1828826 RepID=A0A928Z7X6_9CYAN|nr:PAS domain-containing protein [Zarconia navalis]MBE9039939.1 PAS domain-containing protein [Zarconia navalis LEGE 11467]
MEQAELTLAYAFPECLIRFPESQRPYRITRTMLNPEMMSINNPQSTGNPVITPQNTIWTHTTQWTPELYDALGKMIEADAPMGLSTFPDHRQRWINQAAADAMNSDPQEAIKRKTTNFWLPSCLRDLERLLRQEGSLGKIFEITYQAKLNEGEQWGEFTTRYEIVDNRATRLGVLLNLELIPTPPSVLA